MPGDFNIDGKPADWGRGYRISDESESSGDPIAIDWVSPGSTIIEALYISFSALPTTVEAFLFTRQSALGPIYNTPILTLDFVALATLNYMLWGPCCAWRFEPNDHLLVSYLNTDDGDIGIEILGSGWRKNRHS